MADLFDTSKHKIYEGVRSRGGATQVFAKCRCGAVLYGREQIDEHREEMEDGQARSQ